MPDAWTPRVGVLVKLIATTDVASSSKMTHISTTGRGRVYFTGAITIHNICVGEGDDNARINRADNADNSIVSSSSSSYWGRTTNQTKEDILQRCVLCIKSKCDPESSREHNIHHANTTKALSQSSDAVKNFISIKLEGKSKSTKYNYI